MKNERARAILQRVQEEVIETGDGEYRFSLDHEEVLPGELAEALGLAVLIMSTPEQPAEETPHVMPSDGLFIISEQCEAGNHLVCHRGRFDACDCACHAVS